ncbi:uncharacterized protein LOC108676603 [Hyalella azteca]|uniref:Uncharacterized protein LOC108676603 n=1 Tax=Hyalella azteca TaxID=294128 RepID=A0A979FMN6_HYAAZ|nr:uncharacterized protein LOC108676603 [Hyalella azteca]
MSECEWEVLDVGGDDETRQSATGAVSFTSLYEVVKLAYLQPANPSSFSKEKLPHVVSSAAYGMVCVALEKTILLFAENCSTLVLQLPLPHTIDTATASVSARRRQQACGAVSALPAADGGCLRPALPDCLRPPH